ncbi:hypothetical protein K8R62_02840 [bacterium]|nr:hypothetical protein [bacterium]
MFCYVLIGEERIPCRMIMCHSKDCDKKNIKKLARIAFPELFGFLKFLWRSKKLKIKTVYDYEGYPSYFDGQVAINQENNNWNLFPYITLETFLKGKDVYCRAVSYAL